MPRRSRVTLPALCRCIEACGIPCEIIVADGGNSNASRTLAARYRARYFRVHRRGRAAQMNAGARLAHGRWLWFLHADCIVPPNALTAMSAVFSDEDAHWGAFDHIIDHPAVALRIIEWFDNKRAKWLHMPYGDQAIFVRRTSFKRVGGYRCVPILEEVLLAAGLGNLRNTAHRPPPRHHRCATFTRTRHCTYDVDQLAHHLDARSRRREARSTSLAVSTKC